MKKNKITKRTAANRERNSAEMLQYFREYYKDNDVDFEIISSILIGGIFYLIMHRNIAPFCSVDFKKKENIGLLKKNIQIILDRVLITPEEK
ncbi:MAG: hypothetical protein LUD02_10765 [Tannerellaceae bacterium]|nr:hypothetical protein [Tannerellaceae bacterium]